MNPIDLYELPKDMLVKLIATIQKENIREINCMKQYINCAEEGCEIFINFSRDMPKFKNINCLTCYKFYCDSHDHLKNHKCNK